jgi:hypothetical protein
MKNSINRIGLIYVIFTLIYIKKIISTDIGLLIYAATSILMMIFVLYINRKENN